MSKLFTIKDKVILIRLKVTPCAHVNKIENFIKIESNFYLKVFIKMAPKNNKANDALIKFLSNSWQVPVSHFEIKKGKMSSFKTLAIKNLDLSYLNLFLNTYITI